MKKTIIAALALVAMAGCNKTLIEMPVVDDAGYGYLTLGITSNPDMVITKAGEGTEVTDTYYFTLLYSSTETGTYNHVTDYTRVTKKTITDQDETEDGIQIKLQSGWYKLQGMSAQYEEYTENAPGDKYLFGESDAVYLAAGGENHISVGCYVYNTAVSVETTSNFSSTFLNEKVTVSTKWGENDEKTRSYVFCEVTGDIENTVAETGNAEILTFDPMVFFPAYDKSTADENTICAKLEIKIEANTAASGTDRLEYTLNKESIRARWTQITLDAGTNGTIHVKISAVDDLDISDPVEEEIILDPTSSNTIIENN